MFYQAYFAYQESEENLPIEDVWLMFPCPNVENESVYPFVFTEYYAWTLYWMDDENVMHPQVTRLPHIFSGLGGVHVEDNFVLREGLKSPRTSIPEIQYSVGYTLDKLYPGEVFWVSCFAPVSKENVIRVMSGSRTRGGPLDKVTLRVYGDNESRSIGLFYYEAPATGIDCSFWAQLAKKFADKRIVKDIENFWYDNLENYRYETVEIFGRSLEDKTPGWVWLYPVK